MRKVLLILLMALFLVAGCGSSDTGNTDNNDNLVVEITTDNIQDDNSDSSQPEPANSYTKITPQEAQEMMAQEGIIILDVRTEEEFAEGHIPNAVLLPDTEVKQRAEELLPDKEQTILVYCRSGRRSALAAQELADMGYTNVYDFGGILDWTGDVVK